MRLGKRYEDFEKVNAEIFAITPDREKNAKKLEDKYAKYKFPIYYDPKKTVLKKLNQEVNWVKLGRMPGLLIVDTEGTVRYAYYSSNMHDIPKNDILLEELAKLQN